MARIERVICDRCERETTDEHQVSMRVQDKTLELDLCAECFHVVMSGFISDIENMRHHET